jgi:acyl-CoA synthetase (AMP-forming)/AMP-acid ligase II/aryl carrier-like protein
VEEPSQTVLASLIAHPAESPAVAAPGRPVARRADLLASIAAVGACLRGHGVRRPDRVAILLPPGAELARLLIGVASAAAAAPLNPACREAELAFHLDDLAPAALIVPAGSRSPAIRLARERRCAVLELEAEASGPAGGFVLHGIRPAGQPAGSPAPEDVALVLHTSGTTARPKQVPLTHANLAASMRHVVLTLRLGPADVSLVLMPLFHVHGLVAALLAALHAGGVAWCPPGFSAPEVIGWLTSSGATWYTAVPAMHESILDRARGRAGEVGGHRLRLIRSSSSALPPAVLRELEATFGVPVIEAYGMTEAAHQIASNPLPPDERRPGTVGRAAGPEIVVLGPDGRPALPGTPGEIAIRGPNVTAGYAGQAAAARAADGWLRTGDEGVLDGDGWLTILGRRKELIDRGSQKVSPAEVEQALIEHPAVARAVAFGVPDRRLGEQVAAAVVLETGAAVTELALREHAEGRLADYKVPRRIAILDELPYGSTGKPDRRGLAARLALEMPDPALTAEPVAPRNPLEASLLALWREVLGDTVPFGVEDPFVACGGDSLLATRLLSRIRSAFVIEVSMAALLDHPTIAEQARLVSSRMAAASTPAEVERLLALVESLDEEEAARRLADGSRS